MTNPTAQALPDGRPLKYSIFHEAFWWAALPADARPNSGRPTIQVSGGAWEFGVVEYQISGSPVLRLMMFADSWVALREIPRFFAELPDCDTLDTVRELLDDSGAVDETDRRTTRATERRSRLERAAEVLYVQGVSESGLTPAWDRQPDSVRQNWIRRARVVLDAAEKEPAA